MSTAVDIGSLIVRTPEIRGGRARIAGTNVTVQRIASWNKLGMTAEEMVRQLPHLTLAQVYAALSYYHANREEIDQQLLTDEVADSFFTSCVLAICPPEGSIAES